MAHFNPIVMARFSEVHLGPPTDVRFTPAGQSTQEKFASHSRLTNNLETYHASGQTAGTLQQAFSEAETAYRDPNRRRFADPSLEHSLPQAGREYYNLQNELRDIGDFKRTLVRKNSEQALNALEDTETELKDFGKTHEKSSLPERLLGDSGFQPIAQFMGNDHEAELFIARILKRSFQKDITEAINSGRWQNPEQYDPEAMAQQQAKDVVEAYRNY